MTVANDATSSEAECNDGGLHSIGPLFIDAASFYLGPAPFYSTSVEAFLMREAEKI